MNSCAKTRTSLPLSILIPTNQKSLSREHIVAKTKGGISPIGWIPNGVTVLIDETLNDYEVVWAATGHLHAVFPTTFAVLIASRMPRRWSSATSRFLDAYASTVPYSSDG